MQETSMTDLEKLLAEVTPLRAGDRNHGVSDD